MRLSIEIWLSSSAPTELGYNIKALVMLGVLVLEPPRFYKISMSAWSSESNPALRSLALLIGVINALVFKQPSLK